MSYLRYVLIAFGIIALVVAAWLILWNPASQFGHFDGSFSVEFDDPEGRTGRTLNQIEFTDPDGTVWKAPAGIRVDGASIPQALWSIVGSPFTGRYRRASVIHDHYCVTKERNWEDVHRVFYLASRADGVPDSKAKIMYAAVMAFGPRWQKRGRLIVDLTKDFNQAKFQDLVDWVETSDPSIDEIMDRTGS